MIANLTIKFQSPSYSRPLGSSATEILYTWMEAGEECFAMTRITRMPWSIEYEKSQFKRRNGYEELGT